jgi:hypothetical protein
MAWLTEIPQAVVRAHIEMLERIKAQEGLAAAAATGLGLRMKASSVERWTRRWNSADAGPAMPATPADLTGVGIGVRVMKDPEQAKRG